MVGDCSVDINVLVNVNVPGTWVLMFYNEWHPCGTDCDQLLADAARAGTADAVETADAAHTCGAVAAAL